AWKIGEASHCRGTFVAGDFAILIGRIDEAVHVAAKEHQAVEAAGENILWLLRRFKCRDFFADLRQDELLAASIQRDEAERFDRSFCGLYAESGEPLEFGDGRRPDPGEIAAREFGIGFFGR